MVERALWANAGGKAGLGTLIPSVATNDVPTLDAE